jgi:predicted nucleic acid-binding protein
MNDRNPERAYIDANVFVEMFEKNSNVSAQLRRLFVHVEETALSRFTSELTLAELLVKPMKDRNAKLVEPYTGFMQSGPMMEVVSIDRQMLYTAAMTRAEDGSTKLPDAIHVATALERECHWFVTGDRAIKSSPRAITPFQIIDPFASDFEQFLEKFGA